MFLYCDFICEWVQNNIVLYRTIIIGLLFFLYRAFCYEKRRGFLSSVEKLFFQYVEDQKKLEGIKDVDMEEKYGKSYQQLLLKTEIIKKYILDTGIKEPFRPNVENVGYGGIQTSNFSVLDHFYQLDRADVPDIFYKTLKKAIGYYEQRRNETFNPLFWIEYFIFLPKQILGYFGVSSQTIVHIVQAIYWIVGILYSILKIYKLIY